MIPYGRHTISADDTAAVSTVMRSDWLTQGPTVELFEQAMARRCGAENAVAVSNATAALHLGCLALGLGPGEMLWTSPITFVASANCARYCHADVDFVDIDSATYNMSVGALAKKLGRAAKQGRLPKVVIPVHFAGQPCDMMAIAELAREYGFSVIEDASHAIGSEYRGTRTGSCAYSDMTVFSFHPVKILTTGEGGMILTNRPDLHRKLMRLRSHGITREMEEMDQRTEGPWYYEQLELGYNYRLTDIQAALGISQLARLDEFVLRRRQLAARYDRLLADLPVVCPAQKGSGRSSYHLYPVCVRRDPGSKKRLDVFKAMRASGIGVNVHYIPVHLQPYYRQLGFHEGDFPEAERYYEGAITLPLYYSLSESEQDRVVATLSASMA